MRAFRSVFFGQRVDGARRFLVLQRGAGLCAVLGALACDGGGTSPGADGGANAGGMSGVSGSVSGSAGDAVGGAGAGAGGMGGGEVAGAGGSTAGTGGDAGSVGTSGAAGGGAAGTSGGTGSGGNAGSGNSWDGCEEFIAPPDCTIPEGAVLPGELRCTGLYSSWDERTLRCGVTPYAPAHELWADGAGKQRYVWLPPGQTLDVSDPDDFDYPVGTRFWKEFHVGPEGSQKLGETRYLLKADVGWLYTAYVWSEDGTSATQRNDGVDDLYGTGHSVPSREQCKTCHIGRPNFVLGWDFIMLGEGATGVTARSLAEEGRLGEFDPALLELEVPGDAVERAALTYLHANCGVSCHNTTVDATANPSGLYLRLEVDALDSPLSTGAAAGINQDPAPNAKLGGLPMLTYYDFRPGDPERSLVYARMGVRGSDTGMPPLGTHVVHEEGVDAVRAWIESMTEERGYPAPAP